MYKMSKNKNSSVDFDPVWKRDNIKFNHHKNIPNNFRMLIVGPSGCGKTYLLLKMLLQPNYLDYENIIIFSPTITQSEFKLLEYAFNNCLTKKDIIDIFDTQFTFDQEMTIASIVENIKEQRKRTDNTITIEMFKKCDKLMDPSKLPRNKKNLIVFDDAVNLKSQDKMKAYFTRGRHSNCNAIYLSQNYYDLDKNSIRGNSNFYVFFRLPHKDKDSIYRDLFSNVLDKELFNEEVRDCWRQKYSYIALNKENENIYNDIFATPLEYE